MQVLTGNASAIKRHLDEQKNQGDDSDIDSDDMDNPNALTAVADTKIRRNLNKPQLPVCRYHDVVIQRAVAADTTSC